MLNQKGMMISKAVVPIYDTKGLIVDHKECFFPTITISKESYDSLLNKGIENVEYSENPRTEFKKVAGSKGSLPFWYKSFAEFEESNVYNFIVLIEGGQEEVRVNSMKKFFQGRKINGSLRLDILTI
jgi:hypothetical protein